MKRVKKIILLSVVLLALAGAAAGGVWAYRGYQEKNLKAEVQSVANLNWGYFEDSMYSSGYVTNDYVQNVYLEDRTVAEVKVAEGDAVEIGDPLLVFDTTEAQLEIDMKKLEIQGIENDITLANRELEKLKKITPVPDSSANSGTGSSAAGGTGAEAEEEPESEKASSTVVMEPQKKEGDAYNYIDKSAKPYAGEGTAEEPYRFLCTSQCYVKGSYLNLLIKKEQAAAFEIWSANSREEGTLVSCWTVDGTGLEPVEADARFSVSTRQLIEEDSGEDAEEEEEDEEESSPEDGGEEDLEEEAYTVTEQKEAISEQEDVLKNLDVEKRKADLELQKLEKDMESGTVLSSIKGVVKSVGDPENPPTDGSAFLEVAGSEGLYVKGTVSELLLDQVEVGQSISASSWESGETYMATITEISEYPEEESGGYYGEGNPNASYYAFTAYIEDTSGLSNGDYIDISMSPADGEEQMNALYIEKAYVRQENGQYYVLKAGEDGRLVKQYVQTGKTIYGSAIEIKSGLSEEDWIAFPYGKAAKEGVRAVEPGEE